MSVFTGVAAKVIAAAKAFKAEVVKIAGEAPAVIAKIEADAPEVEALSNLIYPGASAIEAAGLAVLEKVAEAVEAAGAAAGASGLSVTLDQATIQAVKAVVPTLKASVK